MCVKTIENCFHSNTQQIPPNETHKIGGRNMTCTDETTLSHPTLSRDSVKGQVQVIIFGGTNNMTAGKLIHVKKLKILLSPNSLLLCPLTLPCVLWQLSTTRHAHLVLPCPKQLGSNKVVSKFHLSELRSTTMIRRLALGRVSTRRNVRFARRDTDDMKQIGPPPADYKTFCSSNQVQYVRYNDTMKSWPAN